MGLLHFFPLVLATAITSHAEWQASPLLISPPAQQVTSRGQNRNGLFVSSDEILFVSRDRQRNQDPQIFIKSLKAGYEQQLTHQRGNLELGGVLEKKQGFVFSSTTDEEKESPLVLRPYLERSPSTVDTGSFVFMDFSPQEIYLARLDGSGIQRLSQNSGYDGMPGLRQGSDLIYFTRWQGDHLRLYAGSLNGSSSQAWPLLKSEGHDLGVTWSPNRQDVVWTRFKKDFSTAHLMIGNPTFKKVQPLTTDESSLAWGAAFHPSGTSVLYSARRPEMSNFDLFEISRDGKCGRQISSFEGDEYLPSVSPDGKSILFTSTQSGSEQLFTIPYPTAPLNCP